MSSVNGKLKILFNNYIYAREHAAAATELPTSRWQQNGRQWLLWIFTRCLCLSLVLSSLRKCFCSRLQKHGKNLNKNENIGENSFGLLSHRKTFKRDTKAERPRWHRNEINFGWRVRYFLQWNIGPETESNKIYQKPFCHYEEWKYVFDCVKCVLSVPKFPQLPWNTSQVIFNS